MRILMTGATGYIDAHIIMKLHELKYTVACIVRDTSDLSKIEPFTDSIIQSSSYRWEEMYPAIVDFRPDLFLHLAAFYSQGNDKETIEKLIDTNIVFPEFAVDAAWNAGCRFFINTTTYTENFYRSHYSPCTIYAATKKAFSDLLHYYHELGARIITLVLFDVYGRDDQRPKVLNLIRDMKDGEHIDMSSGEQKLFPVHIDDITSAFIRTVELISNDTNICTEKYAVRGEKAYTLKEWIELYIILSRKMPDIRWGKRQQNGMQIMDPTGYGEVLPGWIPTYDLVSGMKEYCGVE